MNQNIEHTNKNTTVTIDEKSMSLLAHVTGLLFSFVGPLVMYLMFKENHNQNLKQNIINSLNWQISLMIYFLASGLLTLLLVGFILIFALTILNIVFCILASLEANKGNVYKYPLTIEFIKLV